MVAWYNRIVHGIIYCVTNTVNGKQYVGQTTHTFKWRWQRHLASARCGSRGVLHSAICKYGIEVFKVEQIDFAESRSELNEKEVYHIARCLALVPDGYNLAAGGEGSFGYAPTRETRRRLSEALTGKVRASCMRGHPFSGSNLWVAPSTGHQVCMTCYHLRNGYKLPARLQQCVTGREVYTKRKKEDTVYV